MMYLLAKLIIEKNASSISMIKILGYSNGEASKLYNHATAIVVIVSLLLSVVLGSSAIRVIYYTMMKEYPGWLTFYLAPWGFPLLIGIGIICFVLVTLILNKKIKKIPLSQALKNME
jgi:putative ABC transport system permease protein